MSSGKPVRVGDTNLWGMEIDVAAAAEEIRSIGKADKGKGVEDVLGSFGLGAFADQLKDLRLSKRHYSDTLNPKAPSPSPPPSPIPLPTILALGRHASML